MKKHDAKKVIGPDFSDALEVAGLLGLPYSWGEDGTFEFDDSVSQADINRIIKIAEEYTFDEDGYKIKKEAKDKLVEIDLKSIRSIREYVAALQDAPQEIKQYEQEAKTERDKLNNKPALEKVNGKQ